MVPAVHPSLLCSDARESRVEKAVCFQRCLRSLNVPMGGMLGPGIYMSGRGGGAGGGKKRPASSQGRRHMVSKYSSRITCF